MQGYRLDALGEYYVQSDYFTSDYILAKSETYYAVNYTVTTAMQRICFYDKNKKFISENISSNIFQTPEGCKYIRICNELTYLDTAQLEEDKNSTDFVEHEQTDYILNIQQEMLKGDYFSKEADGWKELHNYSKIELTGEETVQHNTNYTNSTMVQIPENNSYNFFIPTDLNATYVISNKFLGVSRNECASEEGINTIALGNNAGRIFINVDNKIVGIDGTEINQEKAEKIKNWLVGQGILIYYKSKKALKLLCTAEQSAVLEELNNLDLFEGVNNIITAEDIALLKSKYALDVETYVDNKLNTINQQILEIAGGN